MYQPKEMQAFRNTLLTASIQSNAEDFPGWARRGAKASFHIALSPVCEPWDPGHHEQIRAMERVGVLATAPVKATADSQI